MVVDIDEAGTSNERLQSHDGLQRRRNDHLKTEIGEDIHRQSRELIVRLVECLIEYDRRVHGYSVIIPSQLIPQGCGKARHGQFLALPSRFTSTATVNEYFGAIFIYFPPNELDMLPDIQHGLAPAFLLGVLTGKPINESTQRQEARLRKFSIPAPGMAEHLLDFLLELFDLEKLPVVGVDVEIGTLMDTLIEWHLAEIDVNHIQPFENGLPSVVQIGGERSQILMALVLQQFKKSLLMSG